jgi:hypothetical protein
MKLEVNHTAPIWINNPMNRSEELDVISITPNLLIAKHEGRSTARATRNEM